ncbi:MAG: hypothetical protein HOO96_09040 [Polyangiaceae bacterium]|nr:hypothetical protein [Polyangiaceae bacterium]
MSARSWVAVATLAALTAAAQGARANGRIPAANQIVVSPDFPETVLLRTTFGLLVSRDAGKKWDWICESGMQYGGAQDPSFGLTKNGTLLASTFEGLTVSRDGFCTFAREGGELARRVFSDLTVRPNDRRQVLALASDYASTSDAGAFAFASQVFRSGDDGSTFTALGPALDTSLLFETVEVAESDPQRLYLSATRTSAGVVSGVLLVSRNGGASYVERAVPLLAPQERAPFVSAVDPKNPDRLYVRTAGQPDAASRLLVSDDAGDTFREVFRTSGPMLGLALTADGATIYAGSTKDGVYAASTQTFAFEKRAAVQVQCLTATEGALWACSNEASGFVAGRSTDGGRTFTPMLRLSGIRGPLACPVGTTTQTCESEWPRLRQELGIDTTVDAGTPAKDAGSTTQEGPRAGGSSCSSAADAGPGLAVTLGVCVAALGARARKRRRDRSAQ